MGCAIVDTMQKVISLTLLPWPWLMNPVPLRETSCLVEKKSAKRMRAERVEKASFVDEWVIKKRNALCQPTSVRFAVLVLVYLRNHGVQVCR